MANEMPVLPLVGSRTVQPGVRTPSRSACSTMKNAGRSLMDPVGLRSSSLAHRRTPCSPASQRGDRFGSPTSGVWPRDSSSESKRAIRVRSAAGDGGQDRDDVTVRERGGDAAEEADVLVVEVDVDETVQRAVVGDEPAAQPVVPGVEVGKQVVERLALAVDGLVSAGVATEDGRDPDFDGHGHSVANAPGTMKIPGGCGPLP